MNGTTLRRAFNEQLSRDLISGLAGELGVIERERKLELVALAWSLVLVAGSDDSGRLADAYSAYLEEADEERVRGSFYAWFTEKVAMFGPARGHPLRGRSRGGHHRRRPAAHRRLGRRDGRRRAAAGSRASPPRRRGDAGGGVLSGRF